MSIMGILASNLFASGAQRSQSTENNQSTQNIPSKFQQIGSEFQQLGQDLQAGNLSGAQSAFAALASDLQQIGGFATAGSSGSASTPAPASTGSVNVSA